MDDRWYRLGDHGRYPALIDLHSGSKTISMPTQTAKHQKRSPPTQVSLRTIVLLMIAASIFLAVGTQTDFSNAIFVVGMPVLGLLLIEIGIRLKNDTFCDLLVKTGAMTIAISAFFLIPALFDVIIAIVQQPNK